MSPRRCRGTLRGNTKDRNFAQLPILADLLQDAGCESEDVLKHLRSGGEHVRGCWALDIGLGKE